MSWLLTLLLIYYSFHSLRNRSYLRLKDIPVSWTMTAFGVKLAAMAAMIWIYSFHYTDRNEADIFKYYDDGVRLSQMAWKQPLGFVAVLTGFDDDAIRKMPFELKYWDRPESHGVISSNRLIIRFNALLALLSGGNIWFHSTVACMLSFFGLMLCYTAFIDFAEGKQRLLFILLFGSPSLLFWSSGILKEAFIISGMGCVFFALFRPGKARYGWHTIAAAAVGLWMLASVKLYLLLCFAPAATAWLWVEHGGTRKTGLKYAVTLALFAGLALNVPVWVAGYDALRTLTNHQQEFKCLAEWIGAGSTVHIRDLDGSLWSFVLAAPEALFNAFLRPWPFDRWTVLTTPAILEVLAGCLFLVFAVSKRQTPDSKSRNMLYFSTAIVLIMALPVGWTTPVAGAIVRYRIPYLPFLILIISVLTDRHKLPGFLCLPK